MSRSLPLRRAILNLLVFGAAMKQRDFDRGQAAFSVQEPGKAYYVGDLVVAKGDRPVAKGTALGKGIVGGLLFGPIVGGIALSSLLSDTGLRLEIHDDVGSMEKFLSDRFHTSIDLTPAFVRLATPTISDAASSTATPAPPVSR